MAESNEVDPTEFVQRIRKLGEQRDQQDAERVRKLEEEILQGRSERQARRAERQRSISPQKSATSTPQSLRSAIDTPKGPRTTLSGSETPKLDPSTRNLRQEDTLDKTQLEDDRGEVEEKKLASPHSEHTEPTQTMPEPPKNTASPSTGLARSGTLSWQQRPTSLGARRPFSMVGTDSVSRSPRATPDPQQAEENSASRAEIAQNLESKDPSWFRQTPDRGTGSPAYRRSQDDVPKNEPAQAPMQLPGMTENASTREDLQPSRPDSLQSTSPSRTNSVRDSAIFSNRFSSNTSISEASSMDSRNPSSADEEKIRIGRSLAMSPTQSRVERTPSPTKGAGGFVQSAFMKRSDSVKRWSAQAGPGLSRQSSTASNRSGIGGVREAKSEIGPTTLSRGNSLEPGSRPSSSHSNTTITQEANEKAGTADNSGFVKPSLPLHARSKSVVTGSNPSRTGDNNETSPPPSPSKRWSPTKSSWLESALNKPDSPKPKMAPPQQPSWMQEINKAKQQRAGGDSSRAVETVKSPVLDTKGTSESPTLNSTSQDGKSIDTAEDKSSNGGTKDRNIPGTPASKAKPSSLSPQQSKHEPGSSELSKSAMSTTESKDNQAQSTVIEKTKVKPETPPKRDFRANLKQREESKDVGKKAELEFQNVFGKLKSTRTEKYVAPDELKNNILRGKAGLAVTGGPKPSARRDELKESLIKQKEAMKAKALEAGPPDPSKKTSAGSQSVPEALAKRQNFGRYGGSTSTNFSKETGLESVPKETENVNSRPGDLKENAEVQPPKKNSGSSKLAERFNPALAGILARGPRPVKASDASEASVISSTAGSAGSVRGASEKSLTHMTKGRARGPKRRAPASRDDQSAKPTAGRSEVSAPPIDKTSPKETRNKMSTPVATPTKNISKQSPVLTAKSPPTVSPKPNITSVPLVRPQHILHSTTQESDDSKQNTKRLDEGAGAMPSPSTTAEKEKPSTPGESPTLAFKYDRSKETELAATQPKNEEAERAKHTRTRSISPEKKVLNRWSQHIDTNQPPTPTGSSLIRPTRSTSPQKVVKSPPLEQENASSDNKPNVKGAAALWARQTSPDTSKSVAREPIKLPTRKDEEAAMENAGLIRSTKSAITGLGVSNLNLDKSAKSFETKNIPLRSKENPASPPPSGKLEPDLSDKVAPPVQTSSDHIFAPYFDIPPDTSGELPRNIDTQAILDSYPVKFEKVKTLRWDIHEITGDGKLTPLTGQEQNVLFDESMYVCTHVFGTSETSQKATSFFSPSPRQANIYLWVGCAVPESTLEDVQLFARRVAKENSGNLVVVRHGKEPPEFFEAFGGIVVVRKGSRISSANYLLCGRKHLTHITFDERPFSLKSLCSGFAYLIMAEKTLYLWKGRGSNLDEISAARLIGMDMCTSGALVEIQEGSEDPSPSFLSSFPQEGKGPHAVPRSADHWRHKASSDRYRTRLFRVEQSQGQQQGLKVSAFLPGFMLRRPSWQSLVSPTISSPQSQAPPLSPLPTSQEIATEVTEVAPFVQSDLAADKVFVLDAFFEVYILIQPLTRDQSHAFSTALLFAQEYAILAASAEDRPFVPVCTVIMEGVPRDMKFVFRRWEETEQDTGALMAGRARPGESTGLTRGRSLKICGLEKALRATR